MAGPESGTDDPQYVEVELVTVFVPRSMEQYLVAASILDGEKIHHLDKNLLLQHLDAAGILGPGYNPIFGPIEIQVRKEDADRARLLLKGLQEKPSGPGPKRRRTF